MPIINVILAIILILLQVGDWWTTRRALATGKDREANPLMARLIAWLGLDRAFFAKGIVVALIAIACVIYPQGLGGLVVAIAIYTWVVWHNYTLVK